MHEAMAATLDAAIEQIRDIQQRGAPAAATRRVRAGR